jgi:hypothetical protein
MSLIITKQRSEVFSDRPYSYRNNISNGFIIEPNSEIALVSAVINRGGEFIIDDDINKGRYLGIFLGYALPGSATDENGQPVPDAKIRTTKDIPMSILIPNGVYSNEDLATQIQKEINDNIGHPLLYNKATVETKRNTAGEFQGFKMSFDQNRADTVGALYPDNSIEYIANPEATFYESGVLSNLIATEIWNCAATFIYPVHSADGKFEVELSPTAATLPWIVGLCRHTEKDTKLPQSGSPLKTIYKEGELKKIFGNWFAPNLNVKDFFDVAVVNDGTHIRLYCIQYTSENECEMKEIEYWNTGVFKGNSDFDAVQVNTTYTAPSIQFIISYEKIEVKISPHSNSFSVLSNRQLPAVGSATYSLYPKIYLYGENTVTVASDNIYFDGWDRTKDFYYTTHGKIGNKSDLGAGDISYADYWSNQYIKHAIFDLHDVNDPIPAGIWIENYHTQITTDGSEKYVTFVDPDQLIVVIAGDSSVDKYYYKGDISGFLGFDKIEEVPVSITGSIIKYQTGSKNIPEAHSNNNIYVRVNNLEMMTLNGDKSSISRIVGTIPREDQSGTSTGIIFHEKQNLLFLDLHNKDKVIINHLDVELVDSNEKYAKDLDDYTTVIFLIRKKNM